MERSNTGVRIWHRGDGIPSELTARAEQSLGELFNRLKTDRSELIRDEMSVTQLRCGKQARAA